jgi:hypothetical protein
MYGHKIALMTTNYRLQKIWKNDSFLEECPPIILILLKLNTQKGFKYNYISKNN